MNLTRVYTLLGRTAGVEGVLSVGRVQTPTLRLVVDRDRAIECFVPVNYFEVMALVQSTGRPQPFKMRWQPRAEAADSEGRCLKEPVARAVAQSVARTHGRVDLAVTERKRQAPPLPYDLSTLQQDCSRLFGMTATETLEAAQRLYETHKAATYPRTDCQYLPLAQFADTAAVLKAVQSRDLQFAALIGKADLRRQSRAWNDAKITAHHAIIPTAAAISSDMSPEDRKVFELIARRYLAQFFPDHEYDQCRIEARIGAERFSVTGRTPVVAGWKVVFVEPAEQETAAPDEAPLPALNHGDAVQCLSAEVEAKQTKPPLPYSEGTLIQAMKSVGQLVQDERLKKTLRETSGIGTEATRAAIIETLVLRQYIERKGKKKNLVSTAKGRLLIDAVPGPIKDPGMTALWEQALEEIAAGKAPLAPFMERQTQWVRQLVEMAKRQGSLSRGA
jgi:DNA topoisomerase-3